LWNLTDLVIWLGSERRRKEKKEEERESEEHGGGGDGGDGGSPRERENKIERETKGGLNLEESRLYYLSTLFLFHHFLSTKQNLCNFLTLLHYVWSNKHKYLLFFYFYFLAILF
jgi:hypothetical protein